MAKGRNIYSLTISELRSTDKASLKTHIISKPLSSKSLNSDKNLMNNSECFFLLVPSGLKVTENQSNLIPPAQTDC